MKKLNKIYRDEMGATAVEYAMIIGLIALISFAVYKLLGEQVKRIINLMVEKLSGINP